jgi:hypothetical protein
LFTEVTLEPPAMGAILLLFRSQNSPHAVRLRSEYFTVEKLLKKA